MTTYDTIVLGTGGVGSAALFQLARRGVSVLGLDRFPPGHNQGSSHGETRIIRQAYFEHASYVPLLLRSYQLWHELEIMAGEQLLFPVGLLQVGPATGHVVPGVLASARQHGLRVESLSASETVQRFPGFHVPDNMVAVFEQAAGFLRVENCVRAHLAAAVRLGADLKTEAAIIGWRATGSGFEVATTSGTYHAGRLIVTAGPWAGTLLAELKLPLRVHRKHVYWFASREERYRSDRGCPTFLYELPQGIFYGFPIIDDLGLKAAEHSGGTVVDDPLVDPREPDPHDLRRVSEFLGEHLPGVSVEQLRHSVCFYTMTPDEHFIVDRHPQHAGLAFAAGLSGHGFKFASVLGETLADLVLTGQTGNPIDFLTLERFHRELR